MIAGVGSVLICSLQHPFVAYVLPLRSSTPLLKLTLATAPAVTISSFFLEVYDKFPSDKSTALMSWRSTLTTSPMMMVADGEKELIN
jgi:hypothetical protein